MVKRTFLGEKVSQNPLAIPMWEYVLDTFEFSRIVELGTWWGNFSIYFLLFCINCEADFVTYDTVRRKNSRLKRLLGFDKHHRRVDIFENKEEIIKEIQKPGRTILFCDNGDKQKEVDTFAPFLKSGDIIAIHDWNTEVFPSEVTMKLYDIQVENWDGTTKFFMKP